MVTVVTATTGAVHLTDAIDSVKNQTYPNIQHLIFIDGNPDALQICKKYNNLDVIELPYSVGADRFNGHRMYGASAFLAQGEFICFLDEDNWLEPNHISSLMQVMKSGVRWAYSLRRIIDKDGQFVCNDDCESLGKWPTCLGDQDYLIDVGCYFFPKELALQLSPIWYRKAREPGVIEIDRALLDILKKNNTLFDSSGQYTLNYRTGNTSLSVRKEFFIQGNQSRFSIWSKSFRIWRVIFITPICF